MTAGPVTTRRVCQDCLEGQHCNGTMSVATGRRVQRWGTSRLQMVPETVPCGCECRPQP